MSQQTPYTGGRRRPAEAPVGGGIDFRDDAVALGALAQSEPDEHPIADERHDGITNRRHSGDVLASPASSTSQPPSACLVALPAEGCSVPPEPSACCSGSTSSRSRAAVQLRSS